jgi:hypothetical protein
VDACSSNTACTSEVLYFYTSTVPPPARTPLGAVTISSIASTYSANIDYDTQDFTVNAKALAGAEAYQVWARDSLLNPDWVFLGSFNATVATPPVTSESFQVTLPVTFDADFGDSFGVTPLMNGVTVDFVVVGVSGGVAEAIPATTPVAVADMPTTGTTAPVRVKDSYVAVPTFAQAPTPFATSALGQKLYVYYSEPMDQASVAVTAGLPGTSGGVWTWSTDSMTATYTFTTGSTSPAGAVTVAAKDRSNNTVSTQYTAQ